MPTDFKPPGRIVRATATREYLVAHPLALCAACGRHRESTHHVIQKGSPHFGDDVFCNFVALCGDGARGCHGAMHGAPYVVTENIGYVVAGERITQEWVATRIGQHLLRRRPDVLLYVGHKLGVQAGAAFLERTYHVKVPL